MSPSTVSMCARNYVPHDTLDCPMPQCNMCKMKAPAHLGPADSERHCIRFDGWQRRLAQRLVQLPLQRQPQQQQQQGGGRTGDYSQRRLTGAAMSTNRYPPLLSQRLPAGMVACSIAFDSAATVIMKGDVADMRGLRSTSVTMNMANNSRVIVKLEGTASFVMLTDTGQVRRLGTGRTLIGPDMHNLLSPLAMFKDSDSRLHYVHLKPDNSALVLHNGARVPLRWDGRLFHLDYWSTTVAAVVDAPQLGAQVLAESAFGGRRRLLLAA